MLPSNSSLHFHGLPFVDRWDFLSLLTSIFAILKNSVISSLMLCEHIIINDFIMKKRIVHSKKLKIVLHKLRDIYPECVVIKNQFITCLKNKQKKSPHNFKK